MNVITDTTRTLAGLNQVLSSAIVILAFSLWVYMLIHSLRSAVGLSFAVILACMCFTYVGDVALFRVDNLAAAIPWLKFQWVGIAFLPAAYLHFADALLRTTNAISLRRRFTVGIAYFFGFLVLLLAIQTRFLVHDPFYSPGVTQFRSGPFFWVFTTYFYTTLFWGAYKIYVARARCLTSGARRRMTYLAISFFAPALGVYPYMLIANTPSLDPPLLLSILFLVNIGIGVMIVVMAYSVVFFGALPPDRVVKHDLVHFLLRGPVMAIIVIFIVQTLPEQKRILGLPSDIIFATSIVAVIVLWQLFVNITKPFIDSLVSYRDRVEVAWISELDHRLLTTADLQQALENILTTLCETLRVQHGFIYNLVARQGPRLETRVGSSEVVELALATLDAPALIEQKNGNGGESHFIIQNNFWYVILRNKARDHHLGLLAIEARSPVYDLTPLEEENTVFLIQQAELALEDRRLQQEVFMALKNIIPEIERIQRLRSAVRYAGSPSLSSLTQNQLSESNFTQMVRDALSHYWGGPKLTGSPLLSLQVVQDALTEHDDNAVRALRSVLAQAIEKQRPGGERRMTATEWLIYNILDLKFVQGLRVRDIAQRLAMSEADLYRKQKLAIEEVSRTLSEMEARKSPRATKSKQK